METRLDEVEEGKQHWKELLAEFYSSFSQELKDAESALEGVRLKVPEEETDEVCELCGRNMVIKMGRFGKFLACPGFPECKNAKPLVERMPGRCPKCGSGMLKRKSKKGYAFYACEKGAECGFMSWDVPTAEDCPKCGMTMFKKSGKGRNKPFCINETCENFLPEDKRGYYKKKTAEGEASAEAAEEKTAEKPAKKTAKKTAEKKSAAKKTTTKKTATKKTTTKKSAAKKKEAAE
jgi:DNA topoisomerase-1